MAGPNGQSRLIATAEPVALRRVLDNVVNNALRHATHVRFSLGLEPECGTVAILIEDNGPGMALSQLTQMPAVPQHYVTASEEAPVGYGLGLYIAHDLMRLQGGSMSLENLPEGGLRVTLRLVCAKLG